MLLNKSLRFREWPRAQTVVLVQCDRRFDPERGLAVGVWHTDTGPRFLAREAIEPEAAHVEPGRTHGPRISQP